MIWLAVLFGFCVAFVFSGIEAGILSIDRVRLRHRARRHDARAAKLERLLTSPERLLAMVLIVTNFANVTAFALCIHKGVRAFGDSGYFWVSLIYLPVYLIGIELLPKSIFRRFPFRTVASFAGLLDWIDHVLAPFLATGAWLAARVLPRRNPHHRKLFVAREDFKYLMIESERQGALTDLERRMIHSVVDFRNVRAREIMHPFGAIPSLDDTMPPGVALEIAQRVESDYLPVRDRGGRLVGTLNAFDLLIDAQPGSSLSSFVRRAVTVGENERAPGMLRKLRAARQKLAIVVNAQHAPTGVVHLDDLVRRLVGVGKETPPRR